MNTKTTLFLAVVLVALAAVYYAVKTRPESDDISAVPPTPSPSSLAARDLLEEKPGDVVKVVCRKKDGEEWVFERDDEPSDDAQASWRMTSPLNMKCTSWEVTKFGSRLGNLKYEISYKEGQNGAVTAKQAGLDPPEAVVTLTDTDGESTTVEIGRKASARETYVRLQGSDEICLAKSDLTGLVKDKALAYRDKQFWNFNKDDVVRVEILDRTNASAEVSYVLAKSGGRWMFEAPVTAKATGKVDQMLGAMGRLRAIEWEDEGADKLALYGLDPPALTVRATVQEEVPVDEEENADPETDTDEEQTPPAPQIEQTIYELHISTRSPIGEDTKAYLRTGDDSAVATAWKSQTEKFTPVMSEWREMQLTTVDVKSATRIELTAGDGSASLDKDDDGWRFEPDGGRAEDAAVTDLLGALDSLEAVAFVDADTIDPAAYGLDRPQAEFKLTIPGVEGVERITVGAYSDPTTRRLVYVRRNEVASIGKVRKADVDKLLHGPHLYRERTVIDVLPSRYERIALSVSDSASGETTDVTFAKRDGDWTMAEPVEADLNTERMDKLVETLGGLRAQQVVTQTGEPSAFGLHAPDATLSLTYKPQKEYRIETPEPGGADTDTETATDSDATPSAQPVEVQPPSQTITIQVADHDGKVYVQRTDRPVIFEMPRDFLSQLRSEYRADRVLDFDETDVTRFSITAHESTHTFDRRDDKWVYAAEPDLPLDAAKVKNLLVQLADLRTERFVEYAAADLSSYGLTSPEREAVVQMSEGSRHVLRVSSRQGKRAGNGGFYAAVENRDGVFLLTADAVGRFDVSLDALESQ